jgi:branched-chain amino acid transport system ATP-binding protein
MTDAPTTSQNTTPSTTAAPLLEIENLEVRYDAIIALRDVSFNVLEGQVVALIGANGAGKSTTLNTISGLVKPAGGRIAFNGADITNWGAARISRSGLIQVPEGRQIIANMSVQENLEMGQLTAQAPFWQYLTALSKWTADRKSRLHDLEEIFARFPRLKERRHQKAGSLSGGEQQMLAVGRALLSRPRLLMLDEPSMGLAPLLVNAVFDIIKDIKAAGETILIVEQNARKALEVADYAYVLDRGRIVKSGPGTVLRDDVEIVQAYLG